MRFEDWWARMSERGELPTVGTVLTAQCAWDAALCAVQAGMYDERGGVRSGELPDLVRGLHTWNTELSEKNEDI